MLTRTEIKKRLDSTTLTENQAALLRQLYVIGEGLTRQQLAKGLFDDDNETPIAGVLAGLSRVIYPPEAGPIHEQGEDYKYYLQEREIRGKVVLSMSEPMRQAINELPTIKKQLNL